MSKSYFRPNIDAMEGYVPGEQPKHRRLIKLNTNENPYPPSPAVEAVLRDLDVAVLCRYPDPLSVELRRTAGALFGVDENWVIAGNGSDDILTIAIRCFADAEHPIAAMDPSYSLYPILADIQDAPIRNIELDENFGLPSDMLEQAAGANLLILTRPNAPTSNAFPMAQMRRICSEFDGVVLIDEAYVDFADDHCVELAKEFDNVIVARTVSKSYALACVRLGFAIAQPKLIEGMMKVKDSYNVNGITQRIAIAALRDQDHLKTAVERIKTTRQRVTAALRKMGFSLDDSKTNFLFAKPPCAAEQLFLKLREEGVVVRYFSAPRTRDYLRITIGADEEMDEFLQTTKRLIEE